MFNFGKNERAKVLDASIENLQLQCEVRPELVKLHGEDPTQPLVEVKVLSTLLGIVFYCQDHKESQRPRLYATVYHRTSVNEPFWILDNVYLIEFPLTSPRDWTIKIHCSPKVHEFGPESITIGAHVRCRKTGIGLHAPEAATIDIAQQIVSSETVVLFEHIVDDTCMSILPTKHGFGLFHRRRMISEIVHDRNARILQLRKLGLNPDQLRVMVNNMRKLAHYTGYRFKLDKRELDAELPVPCQQAIPKGELPIPSEEP